ISPTTEIVTIPKIRSPYFNALLNVCFKLRRTELYKNSRAEKTHEPFGKTQAEFLNFSYYLFFSISQI
ncbi:hypothetical protein, partial [Olleya namhaensis]|uniref:hypothetical protein n=1 Tax=Olleya namhaensis TaxID=1144750 RepID=UPI001C431751